MPQMVYNNVEGMKGLDASTVVEDITSITLPTIAHPTSEIKATGMAGAVNMPNLTQVEAMEYSIAHNNGLNSEILSEPRTHLHEFRVARQRFNVGTGEVELVSMKVRMTGLHVSTDKGSLESGNPYGSTDKYSCTRYEEEINGQTATLIDIMANKLTWNGKDYTLDVNAFLD